MFFWYRLTQVVLDNGLLNELLLSCVHKDTVEPSVACPGLSP